jgi:hypothetical protein
MEAALLSAIVGGFVTASGWLANNFLAKQREDRAKRLQIGMEATQRQLIEFYAPLQSLLTRLEAVAQTWNKIVEKDPGAWEAGDKIAYTQYFMPIHDEILNILKSKLHLLDDEAIPRSITQYFKHNASESLYWKIKEATDRAPTIRIHCYPKKLHDDIDNGSIRVRNRHSDFLKELQQNVAEIPPRFSYLRGLPHAIAVHTRNLSLTSPTRPTA